MVCSLIIKLLNAVNKLFYVIYISISRIFLRDKTTCNNIGYCVDNLNLKEGQCCGCWFWTAPNSGQGNCPQKSGKKCGCCSGGFLPSYNYITCSDGTLPKSTSLGIFGYGLTC